jgi:hypothetical protein
VLPFVLIILGLPGDALLLRVAWMERVDFRAKPIADLVSFANSSAITFSFQDVEVWSIKLSSSLAVAHLNDRLFLNTREF